MLFKTVITRLALAGMATLFAATAACAEATEFPIGATSITVEPEAGYCAFDPIYVFDKAWLEFQAKANAGNNELIGGFALCNELDGLRHSRALNMSRWIVVLAPAPGTGKAKPTPDLTRATFIKEVAKEFKKGVVIDVKDVAERTNGAFKEAFDQKDAAPITLSGENVPVLLGTTDKGVYAGLTMEVGVGSQSQKIGAVMGMTLVKQHMVSINAYRNFEDDKTINMLLAEVYGLVNRLVDASDR